VKDRRLDLDVAPIIEPSPDEGHHPAAKQKDVTGPLVGPQVDVALPVAQVDVADPPPLVTEAAPGLGQQLPPLNLDGQLAGSGGDDFAVCQEGESRWRRAVLWGTPRRRQ